MTRIVIAVATMFVAATVTLPSANAQSLTKRDIVRSLTLEEIGGTGARTRSFTASEAGVNSGDRAFLNELGTKTRAIVVEERQKIDEIVRDNQLPTLNIEINFAYDSDRIEGRSFASLNALGEALLDASLRDARILLNGHTDAAGSPGYNQALSERRAASVKRYLVDRFYIRPDRLIAIGYGEERLRNIYDPHAAENRRVEIVNLGAR